MSDQTFVSKCLSGEALLTDVDEYVSLWHDHYEGDLSLQEYLGFTFQEYKLWVERPSLLRHLLAARDKKVSPLKFIRDEQERLAARGQAKEMAAVVAWLTAHGYLRDDA